MLSIFFSCYFRTFKAVLVLQLDTMVVFRNNSNEFLSDPAILIIIYIVSHLVEQKVLKAS